ncbi:phospholipase A2 [Nonomuraea sp. NPDC050643]|uniref:phospholipase A2 n=1 Tax=Nonomuraea sp. NPDC050643 TaxID=3155660 RepID=UPI0033F5ED74
MRRFLLAAAVAAALLPLLAVPATADTVVDAPTVPVQGIGPGLYFSESNTYELHELDVTAGAIGRRHNVTVMDGGLARPETTPASRPELSVFGPGWQAEFLGGTIARKLEIQNGAVVVTELDAGISTRYVLTSSVSFPSGGGIQKYEDPNGSKITETTKWDATAGELRTTVVETLMSHLATAEAGDDVFANAADTPFTVAELSLTYTWSKLGTLQGDNWRITGFGTTAFGTSVLTYDSAGRISTIKEPAVDEKPEETVTLRYATATTATAGSFGDYAGQVKEVTLVSGADAPKTVARFDYDLSGRLRSTTDPSSGTPAETYAYDTAGRLDQVNSLELGGWDLSFPANSAAPSAASTELDRPTVNDPLAGATGVGDPNAVEPPAADFTDPDTIDGTLSSPKACATVENWLWYTKKGCSAWAAHYGWHNPQFKNTPTGFQVVGIDHDHCTKSPDKPRYLFWKFDFRVPCDMHDYGYGLIGNTYKGYKWYLDRNKKRKVDNLLFTTIAKKTCPKYSKAARVGCLQLAAIYRVGVLAGKPKKGADATRGSRP